MQKKIKLATFALCSSALALNSMQAMAAQAMTAAPDIRSQGRSCQHAQRAAEQEHQGRSGR